MLENYIKNLDIFFNMLNEKYWGINKYINFDKSKEIANLLTWEFMQEKLKDKETFKKISVLLRSTSFYNDVEKPVSLDDVLIGIDKGYTLQVRNIENILTEDMFLKELLSQFCDAIQFPLDSVTFFYSHPHSVPTAIHKDLGEIFSFQISGKKNWKIAKKQSFTDQMYFKENEFVDIENFVLEAGNFMYLPSYLPHQVKCIDEPSISVAFVFKNISYLLLLGYITDDISIRPQILRPLPIVNTSCEMRQFKNNIANLVELIKDKFFHIDRKNLLKCIENLLEQK